MIKISEITPKPMRSIRAQLTFLMVALSMLEQELMIKVLQQVALLVVLLITLMIILRDY